MLDNKTKGILFMLISSLGFSFMAVSIKYVSGIPLFEKIFFRNLVSLFVALWGLRHMKSFGVLLGQKGNRRYLIGRSVAGLLG
ncbi:MAG: EamA family transporter, partial [Fusobacterium sp.]